MSQDSQVTTDLRSARLQGKFTITWN